MCELRAAPIVAMSTLRREAVLPGAFIVFADIEVSSTVLITTLSSDDSIGCVWNHSESIPR
jgi:hypothetical protein